MNLILSDKAMDLSFNNQSIEFIDLSKLKISNCLGCFSCWTKTPGKCIIRDDAIKIYPKIATSENVLYISKIKYGSYDTIMKTMLERALPIQQAFIQLIDKETHHIQRNVIQKKAIIIGYGDLSNEEKEIFIQLIQRNAKNMCFKDFRVVFSKEEQLEQIVNNEVQLWVK
ncbi:MAG TPA: flavodoxin family protein [Candidatus Caccosoma faecigallinarum]|jgi:hypothetical protein|uniref:Flavodoxin family protein n=1 Tax=Candidatus Caccosoma faecigallinarum TaxID=2840720 RepID=A0A9D1G984_9FIRM|nr:putative uncharacterized protein [Firmicutes bacterium CAG:631]HIT17158.1 flavodoxin family protein [Candidatus Caccosoma faecigallinarum]